MCKNNKLFFTTLKLFESLGDVEFIVIDYETIAITKDQVVFCISTSTDIYLRSDDKEIEHFDGGDYTYLKKRFQRLKKNYLNNHDIFLQIATESYWLASGKAKERASVQTQN